jgi:Tfp pilus assembly protein PilP
MMAPARFIVLVLAIALPGVGTALAAQAAPPAGQKPAATPPAPAPAPAAAPATPAKAPASVPAPPEPQGFTYNPEGRRDPFMSLLTTGGSILGSSQGMRPSGLGGLTAAEVSLKGTMQSRTGYVALVQGADNKTYIVRPGDKLFDGTVRAVTANAMVILQQVNDPLSLEKEREVRKVIRQTDEAK